jgi:hypothetical protein
MLWVEWIEMGMKGLKENKLKTSKEIAWVHT